MLAAAPLVPGLPVTLIGPSDEVWLGRNAEAVAATGRGSCLAGARRRRHRAAARDRSRPRDPLGPVRVPPARPAQQALPRGPRGRAGRSHRRARAGLGGPPARPGRALRARATPPPWPTRCAGPLDRYADARRVGRGRCRDPVLDRPTPPPSPASTPPSRACCPAIGDPRHGSDGGPAARRQVSSSPALSPSLLTAHPILEEGHPCPTCSACQTPSATPVAVDDYLGEFHVYERHKAGLPPLKQYFKELWRRREFADRDVAAPTSAPATATPCSASCGTSSTRCCSPLVYFLLVIVHPRRQQPLPPDYFAHLLGGLFAFYFVAGCMQGGAVVGHGGRQDHHEHRLPAGPAGLLGGVHRVPQVPADDARLHRGRADHPRGHPVDRAPGASRCSCSSWCSAPAWACCSRRRRSTSATRPSFLPYFTRIWLYLSPVLWYPEAVNAKLKPFEVLNPLFSLLGGWGDLLVRGELDPLDMWAAGDRLVVRDASRRFVRASCRGSATLPSVSDLQSR